VASERREETRGDPDRDEATLFLLKLAQGDRTARNSLFARVYEDLRKRAAACLSEEGRAHTLQPTALVHEAWLKLIDQERLGASSRGHFLALAAQAMRRTLVDHARRRESAKRGGLRARIQLDEDTPAPPIDDELDIVAVDEALAKLRDQDEDLAQLVEMRFFAGMSGDDIADATGVSRATVMRQWRVARALMSRILMTEGWRGGK
jgi:RNA polymerase sigma factor (TIGR02999 family)